MTFMTSWKLSFCSKTCPKADAKWIEIGAFDTVKEAAQRIRELEGYPVTGVFLEILVETERGSDEEFFGYLEHTGRDALYAVKRSG